MEQIVFGHDKKEEPTTSKLEENADDKVALKVHQKSKVIIIKVRKVDDIPTSKFKKAGKNGKGDQDTQSNGSNMSSEMILVSGETNLNAAGIISAFIKMRKLADAQNVKKTNTYGERMQQIKIDLEEQKEDKPCKQVEGIDLKHENNSGNCNNTIVEGMVRPKRKYKKRAPKVKNIEARYEACPSSKIDAVKRGRGRPRGSRKFPDSDGMASDSSINPKSSFNSNMNIWPYYHVQSQGQTGFYDQSPAAGTVQLNAHYPINPHYFENSEQCAPIRNDAFSYQETNSSSPPQNILKEDENYNTPILDTSSEKTEYIFPSGAASFFENKAHLEKNAFIFGVEQSSYLDCPNETERNGLVAMNSFSEIKRKNYFKEDLVEEENGGEFSYCRICREILITESDYYRHQMDTLYLD